MCKINIKHLEFIQSVITRHNSNSFKIKGWAIALTTAIFALTGTIKEPKLCFLAIGPIIIFWILDSIFLANERCFISLYNCVSNNNVIFIKTDKLTKKAKKELNDSEKKFTVTDYSMNFVQFRDIKRNNFYSVLFSNTIFWFYFVLVLLTIITYKGISTIQVPVDNKPKLIEARISYIDSLNINPISINTKLISDHSLKCRHNRKK